jgi:hypothetical protein
MPDRPDKSDPTTRAPHEKLPSDASAGETPNDDLNRSIDASITQASVMWLLHRGLAETKDRDISLEQQIVQFGPAVFDAIRASNPALQNVKQERLWLIYFKALLTAETHSHDEMVQALQHIALRIRSEGSPAPPAEPAETAKPPIGHDSRDDIEVLEQIARGLGQIK